MRKKKNIILEKVRVEDYAAEGKSLARVDGKVVFIERVVPGDVVDVRLWKDRKDWAEGYPLHFHSYSADRITPFCQHFGVCGGCQWQMLPYEKQLDYKHRQVEEALRRIGKIKLPVITRIIGADATRYYRNKLEYTFSTKEYFPEKPSSELNDSSKASHIGGGLVGASLSTKAPSSSPNGGGHTPHIQEEGEFYHDADPTAYKALKVFVSLHRKNETKAENHLWNQLGGKKFDKYKFRRQHIIGTYIADFVCLAKKLIIEVDGLIHQLPENQDSDAARTFWLEFKGYKVLRFTNDEVLNSTEEVLNKIKDTLGILPFAEKRNFKSGISLVKASSEKTVASDNTNLNESPKARSVGGGLGEALLGPEVLTDSSRASGASGFHARGFFDKVVEIETCYLQPEPTNSIRNTIAAFARSNNYSFYDQREHSGLLRNLQVRICTSGEVMVNVIFGYDDEAKRVMLLDHLLKSVPGISTVLYTINTKFNDSLNDLQPVVYYGRGYVIENLEQFRFKIGPTSFFQTNSKQAEKLYSVAREFAELKGHEIVYDLYCGTGSIGIFVSPRAKKIIGVEMSSAAIEDAKENAALNDIAHSKFVVGDVIKVCNDEFFAENGRPDVVITDPPRAGMHEKLVRKILDIEAPILVYVSCNPATQARDLALLDEKYEVTRVQPVDMFPHTHHIENVVQLKFRGNEQENR